MISLITPEESDCHHQNCEPKTCDKPRQRFAPPGRIPKNNSFNEKSNSDIKAAMQASLAAPQEPDSPFFRRGRGMTEGADEHQINVLNANTQGMIK